MNGFPTALELVVDGFPVGWSLEDVAAELEGRLLRAGMSDEVVLSRVEAGVLRHRSNRRRYHSTMRKVD